MSDEIKAALTAVALEEGYTEQEIESMLESGGLIFGDLL